MLSKEEVEGKASATLLSQPDPKRMITYVNKLIKRPVVTAARLICISLLENTI